MLILQTERLTIKKLDKNNVIFDAGKAAHAHLSTLSEEALSILMSNKEDFYTFLTELQQIANNQDQTFWGAFLNEEQIASITLINSSSLAPELQIEIAEFYRNCGYGYEFLYAIAHELFMQNPNKIIQYRVVLSNYNSIALVKKVGGQLHPSTNPVENLFLQRYHITASSFINNK